MTNLTSNQCLKFSWRRDDPTHNWSILNFHGEFQKMAGLYECPLIDEIERLRAALTYVSDGIEANATDTVWVGPGETAVDYITHVLSGASSASETPDVPYHQMPQHIIDKAVEVRRWFDERGYESWSIGGIGPRPPQETLERPYAVGLTNRNPWPPGTPLSHSYETGYSHGSEDAKSAEKATGE